MSKCKALLILILACAASRSWAGFVVEVTRGQDNAIPIAVVPFAPPPNETGTFDLAQLVGDDLARSGRFRPMERKDMVELPHVGAGIAFDDWRRLGDDYVVVGQMQAQGTDRVMVSFELYNVLNHQRLIAYQITRDRAQLRRAGHEIADMIFEKIIGLKGAFATRIAYVSVQGSVPNRTFRLIVADADGENRQAVVVSPEPIMSPAWSPDGQSLAYVSFEGRLSTIYVQTLRSGERRVVSAKAGVNQAPAWSPDGKKLALTLSTRDGNLDVYVLDLATQALTRITDDPGIDTEPQWSHDGNSIYFTSDRAGGPQIYRVGLTPGEHPRRLTFQGNYNARPRLSPDESQLAFVTQVDGAYRIAVMDLKGGGDPQILSKGRFDVSPSYAPNGAMILYASRDRGRGVLAIVSSDGRFQENLSAEEGEVQEPAWGPF